MIKQTLYFGNPSYLRLHLNQLEVTSPETGEIVGKVPVEDIGVVIFDNYQVTLTHQLLQFLLEHNVAVVSCNKSHAPAGLFLPLDTHHTQHERFQNQINASVPLKKQLWQQTVSAKITNQQSILEKYNLPAERLKVLSKQVKSDDTDNAEGVAAAYYWKNIFTEFKRDRFGEPPNNALNYGYMVLRAMVARALVGSGLLPTLGIHHRNKYNAYCLADDIMEPYRPFVDYIVKTMDMEGETLAELTRDIKSRLLQIGTVDVVIDKNTSPLMVALSRTTASLAQCFEGTRKTIVYPTVPA